MTEASPLRLEWNIKPEQILVLYAGNMGEKQGLEILVDCARLLETERNIFFVLCGEGVVRQKLENQAAGLPNMRFVPLQPVERLNALLNAADVHVLPQRADAADLVMPSKLTGMFASQRPVLATALPGTQLALVIEQAGMVVPPGDTAALAECIRQLAARPTLRAELGRRGRVFVESHWAKDRLLREFLQNLELLVQSKRK
jgi:colanic acid biosynthesis glycosyl transferase WcaI